jgi:tRNA-dihydrouridine synthase
MQGLTNRVLRAVYGELARPDVLFTEFVRVRPKAKKVIADSDFIEATTRVSGIPLVVQVIGCADDGVVEAVGDLVAALRQIVPGSLSVKTRLGIDDEREIFSVIDSFSKASVDFLIVHSRTVNQKYKGRANHDLSREIVQAAGMPVIANGDIRSVPDAQQVLSYTGAAGLMIGRGAIGDHRLFERIRGNAPAESVESAIVAEVCDRLRRLLAGYQKIFHGDAQVLAKFKEVLSHIDAPEIGALKRRLRKAKSCAAMEQALGAGFKRVGSPSRS